MIRRRKPRSSRDQASLNKLAWLASLPGARGRDSLLVLQDALLECCEPALRRAMRRAKRLSESWDTPYAKRWGHRPAYVVVYVPSRHRKGQNPFGVTMNPWIGYPLSVVVWSGAHSDRLMMGKGTGWNVHHYVEGLRKWGWVAKGTRRRRL